MFQCNSNPLYLNTVNNIRNYQTSVEAAVQSWQRMKYIKSYLMQIGNKGNLDLFYLMGTPGVT